MNKPSSPTAQLEDSVRKAMHAVQNEVSVSSAMVASRALLLLDPDSCSPPLVAWGCTGELRQIARRLLRHQYDADDRAQRAFDGEVEAQQTLWEGKLQDRYPVKRGEESQYVLRDFISDDEGWEIAARMLKTIGGHQEHYDAFVAWLESRRMAG